MTLFNQALMPFMTSLRQQHEQYNKKQVNNNNNILFILGKKHVNTRVAAS